MDVLRSFSDVPKVENLMLGVKNSLPLATPLQDASKWAGECEMSTLESHCGLFGM